MNEETGTSTRPEGWEVFILGMKFQLGLYDFHCTIVYLGGTSNEYTVSIQRYPLPQTDKTYRTFEAGSFDEAVRDGMKLIGEMVYEQMQTFDYSQHDPVGVAPEDAIDRMEINVSDIQDKLEEMQKDQNAINYKLDSLMEVIFPRSKGRRKSDHYASE